MKKLGEKNIDPSDDTSDKQQHQMRPFSVSKYQKKQIEPSNPNAKPSSPLSPSSGLFLSRSQDCLDGGGVASSPVSTVLRKASTPWNNYIATRPQSSLGIPKFATRPHTKTPSTPIKETEMRIPDRAKVTIRRVAQHQADAHINKTKFTVTELQKTRQNLEMQVSDLTKKSELKKAEIATYKITLRKEREIHSDEICRLSNKIESLRKLAMISNRNESQNDGAMRRNIAQVKVDAATDPIDLDNSDQEQPDWDGQSCSSEISVACLQDRIVQMQETHHCTTEELQATLQELTDLQDIVNDLNTDNLQLADDKHTLAETIFKQRQKLDRCRLQIDNLKHLLLSGREFHRPDMDDDREGRFCDFVRELNEELEDIKCNYVDVRSTLSVCQEEHRERAELVQVLRDRARLLQVHNESVEGEKRATEERLLEEQTARDKDRRELKRLSTLFEKECSRSAELQRHSSAANKTDLERMLEMARRDKDVSEQKCAQLQFERQSSLQFEDQVSDLQRDLTLLSDHRSTLGQELGSANEQASSLKCRLSELERDRQRAKGQMAELHKSFVETNERCKRLVDDKNEYKANMVALQRHIDDLTTQKDGLQNQLNEINSTKEQQQEEWMQFQTDLLVAVRVANEFKVETQTDLDRLTDDNARLRLQINRLNADVDRLRNESEWRRKPAEVAGHSGGELKNRIDYYLKGVAESLGPRTKNGRHDSRVGLANVRSMVASIEPCHQEQDAYIPAGKRPALVTAISTSILPPMSARSPSNDPPKGAFEPSNCVESRLKSARSDTRVSLCSAVSEGRDAPLKDEPKSIMTTSKASQPASAEGLMAQKKAAYLDPDTCDPLRRLMKDAPRGSRRNALLKWCQHRLNRYKNVDVTNFSTSWNDGLAFCALVHSYLPTRIPFDALTDKDKRANFQLAFETAASVGVIQTLNVEEMVVSERPDWQAVMAYVTSLYKQLDSSDS